MTKTNFLSIINNRLCYNDTAIAMSICEPGQDRNVAALSYLFMCGGFKK